MSSGTTRSSIPTTGGKSITTRAQAALAELSTSTSACAATRPIGCIDERLKLLVTQRLLDFRRAHAELFTQGAYRPLDARGPRADHVVAFARTFRRPTLRHRRIGDCGRAADGSTRVSGGRDTVVDIPAELDSNNVAIADPLAEVAGGSGTFRVAELFVKLPSAVVAN